MKVISNIYKTKNLRDYGIIISVFLVLLFVAGPLFIPVFKPINEKQIYTINGNSVKYDDAYLVGDCV